jgi:hypothetical protein
MGDSPPKRLGLEVWKQLGDAKHKAWDEISLEIWE